MTRVICKTWRRRLWFFLVRWGGGEGGKGRIVYIWPASVVAAVVTAESHESA